MFDDDERIKNWPNDGNKATYKPIEVRSKKIHQGPFDDYGVNPYFKNEYWYTLREDEINFDDSYWNVPGIDSSRSHSFLSVTPKIVASWWGNHIATYNFLLENQSVQYERQIKSYVSALSETGGMFDIILLVFMFTYEIFLRPLAQLDMLRDFLHMLNGCDD